ncbi:MAG: GDP-L-fucose synthase [Candidatus Omnitrophota bacterium]|jgi:GDP-L-fucose synthase
MAQVNFKNKKVLITGSGGFLGSHLVSELKQNGYKKLFLPRRKEYDLTKQSRVKSLLKSIQPDVIIHCAAVVGGIGANKLNPGKYFYDNLVMGAFLFEESRLANVQKLVALGTICAYPKFTPTPFKESDLWIGYPEETNAPYGLAKKMMLVQSQAYRDQYNFNSIFLLPVNLYGPNDNFDLESSHVIPAMIRKFDEARLRGDKNVTLWGDGSASREFLYVADCARAIRLSLEKYNSSEPVNLGTGGEIKISALAQKIKKLTGFKGQIIWDTTKPNGQPRRRLSVVRAKRVLGFEAKVKLDEGLKKTLDWYNKKVTV